MRARADLDRLGGALEEPMQTFVRESRVRVALLINDSGQLLAQHGFTRRYEVASVASLAAAARASAGALAELTGAERWTHLHHAGDGRELFLAPFRTAAEEVILVAVFGTDTSLGLVRLFSERLIERVRALPEFRRTLGPARADDFERELEAGVEQVFSSESAGEGR